MCWPTTSTEELRLQAALALGDFTQIDGVLSSLSAVSLARDESIDLRYAAFTSHRASRTHARMHRGYCGRLRVTRHWATLPEVSYRRGTSSSHAYVRERTVNDHSNSADR